MKRSAILVNCARGGLVDEAALHRALVDGHLFTAGLDAFSQEPPLGNPLLELDQTVVTPHTAGGTVDNFRRSEEHTSELQSLMRISYAVFCLKKKKNNKTQEEIDSNNYY